MDTNEQQLLELIREGESISTEFKASRNQINRDIYETVCAFLNRYGGTILLGVQDSGEVQGIDPDAVAQIKKDFVTSINNPQKISPPTYLSIEEATIAGKQVLHIFVPESSQVHRCNGRIYDRNEDGDLDITDHTAHVAHLYQRKQSTYSENKVYPGIQVNDLRGDLIERCRKHVRINRENHPWVDMDDLQLLQKCPAPSGRPGDREAWRHPGWNYAIGDRFVDPASLSRPSHRSDTAQGECGSLRRPGSGAHQSDRKL